MTLLILTWNKKKNNNIESEIRSEMIMVITPPDTQLLKNSGNRFAYDL